MKNSLNLCLLVLSLSFCFLSGFSGNTALAAASSQFQNKTTGLGIILGEPTGFTGKFWISHDHAIDAGLAFSFDSYILIYSDFLFHFENGFGTRTEFLRQLTPYVGLGGMLILSSSGARASGRYYGSGSSSSGLGFRIPLGVEWDVPRAPFGIFVELVPGVGIIPGTFGFFQGGIGARYYF